MPCSRLIYAITILALTVACGTPQESKTSEKVDPFAQWLSSKRWGGQSTGPSGRKLSEEEVARVAKVTAAVACNQTREHIQGDATSQVMAELGWTRRRYDEERLLAAKDPRFLKNFVKVLTTCLITVQPSAERRARLKVLAITAQCIRRLQWRPQQMIDTMRALFASQNITAVTYAKETALLIADRAFHGAIERAAGQCPELEVNEPPAPPKIVTTDPEADEEETTPAASPSTKDTPEVLTFIGPLHGRASGRVSLTIQDRAVRANIVIGGRHIQARGQVNHRKKVMFAGRAGEHQVQFQGKFSGRAKSLRGSYKGTVRMVGHSRARRVFGLWSAKRKAPPKTKAE